MSAQQQGQPEFTELNLADDPREGVPKATSRVWVHRRINRTHAWAHVVVGKLKVAVGFITGGASVSDAIAFTLVVVAAVGTFCAVAAMCAHIGCASSLSLSVSAPAALLVGYSGLRFLNSRRPQRRSRSRR